MHKLDSPAVYTLVIIGSSLSKNKHQLGNRIALDPDIRMHTLHTDQRVIKRVYNIYIYIHTCNHARAVFAGIVARYPEVRGHMA